MISVYKDFDDVPKGLEDGDLTEAKKRLREIYHGKCAYTEQKISAAETYILRYRPVSEYPWLEFEWSNLLPVCKMVFERLEGKLFEIKGKKVIQESQKRADSDWMLSKKSQLLHTEVDTPENHLYIGTGGIIYGKTDKGNYTINFCDLNSKHLISKRNSLIEKIINQFKAAVKTDYDYDYNSNTYRNEVLKPIFYEIIRMSKNQSEFSLVGKSIIENFEELIIKKEFYNIVWLPLQVVLRDAYKNYIVPPIIYKKNKKIRYFDLLDRKFEEKNLHSIPYGILGFSVKKYHLVRNIAINHIPANTNWIFLTGENGFGKSLILQTLYVGILGKKEDGIKNIINENSRFIINWKAFANSVLFFNSIDFQGNKFENLFAYGANRLNISGYVNEDEKTQAPQKVNKSDSLFKSDGILYNIEAYLTKMHGREQYEKRIETIKKVLIDLLPSVAAIEIDDSEIDKKVYYREKAENGDLLKRIRFHQLSAGNKSIIAMIGDMLIEFYDGQPDVENTKDFVGIVLIDEIDAHLHPKWQRALVIKLSELFPKVQFIASTHSPIPLLGAPKETVIFNVEKPDRKTGIQVRRLDIDVSQLTPNTILSSPIFGFDDIVPHSHNKEEKLYTQDSYNEVVFEKMLHEKLADLAEEGGKSLEELLEL